jgi:hypothetical protein
MAITLNGGSTATALTESSTSTLSNKTIALGSNSVSGTLAQFNTAVNDADLVSLAGSETLTNKTLTSPVFGGVSISASGNIVVKPATNILEVQGDNSSVVGQIQLNCHVNSHGQKIASQPHAQGATNVLTLPGGSTIGNSDAVLVSDTGTQTLTNKTLTSPSIGTQASFANQAEARFIEATANGTNYVGFKAPSSISSNLVWILPSTDGTANQSLVTNGSGTLSFSESGVSANDQAFAFAVQVFA